MHMSCSTKNQCVEDGIANQLLRKTEENRTGCKVISKKSKAKGVPLSPLSQGQGGGGLGSSQCRWRHCLSGGRWLSHGWFGLPAALPALRQQCRHRARPARLLPALPALPPGALPCPGTAHSTRWRPLQRRVQQEPLARREGPAACTFVACTTPLAPASSTATPATLCSAGSAAQEPAGASNRRA